MFSTVILFVVFLGLIIAGVLLWALFLRLGLYWARVPEVTTRGIVFATVAFIILEVALSVGARFVTTSSEAQSIIFGLVELTLAVIVPWVVIKVVFKANFLRAVQAWLPTLLAPVPTVAFALLVFQPFLFQGFIVPTNGMAPTLLGTHWKGMCPTCGEPNYCSLVDERYGRVDTFQMICDNFHLTSAADVNRSVHAADHFMVAKFIKPRRWDLVVFQYPKQPATLYVKRLVGFPGEKIHIEDGSVWIDGQRQTLPDSLQGLEYLSEVPTWPGTKLWGSENRPALLGNDEYFVLGDFSAQSEDSRFWEQGAPGHHPFAVPQSHIKGVVTHTYWPPDRWRVHR